MKMANRKAHAPIKLHEDEVFTQKNIIEEGLLNNIERLSAAAVAAEREGYDGLLGGEMRPNNWVSRVVVPDPHSACPGTIWDLANNLDWRWREDCIYIPHLPGSLAEMDAQTEEVDKIVAFLREMADWYLPDLNAILSSRWDDEFGNPGLTPRVTITTLLRRWNTPETVPSQLGAAEVCTLAYG